MIARRKLVEQPARPAAAEHVRVISGKWMFADRGEYSGAAMAVRVVYVRNGNAGVCYAGGMTSADVEMAIQQQP